MGTRSARIWYIGAGVIAFVVLLAGWFLLVAPAKSNAADLTDQTAQVEQANLVTQQKIAQLKEQSKDLPALQAQIDAIRTKIPDTVAMPSLVRALSDQAKASGVNLRAVTPSAPATTSTDVMSTVTVELQVSGEFANVRLFVNSLETMQRAFLVTSLNMGRSGSETNQSQLDATITGNVFTSTDFVAPAAAAPADTAPAAAN